MIYGEHVRDLWWSTAEEPLEANQATVVWRGVGLGLRRPDLSGVRLFRSSWTNPKPEVEIDKLEFRIGESNLKPILVSITAE